MNVSSDRLRDDIEANAAFGELATDEGRGRTVLTGSDANADARDYFVSRLEDAGLDVRVDSVGNVVGRWTPDAADPDAAPVAAGSHLDSVPEGGIFDGPLGVYAALESVRTMQDERVELARPVEVVCFTEEEGQRFAGGLLGSSVASGLVELDDALALTDDDGATLESALEEMGYRGEGLVDASEWDSWLELHIEQGTRLEDAGIPVGVVTDVTGIFHCEVEIRGEADHAGSTPMPGRRDALAAASELVLDVEREANEIVETESDSAVGTVGKVNVAPNATNVIPGRVELGIDIRDVEAASISRQTARVKEVCERLERERDVETTFETHLDVSPVPLSERCVEAVRAGADDAGFDCMTLHSGAAHDTQRVAKATDAGMLFSPSRDGISHNPLEWTDWDDCAAAASALAGGLRELASE
ncbi:M20 family metallo-hydrolase [Halogeometricum limi]|uniref:N-carbamoyl-L-amino-acid hydrolase n=1 Tax=Halogeometricum limi TaxID=555875 RepID=A0A1I6ILK6_9EURY|nr:M20 family metallo-hydrolase [Halogeometricum limi]SFR67593.1 N-carbamoyl-L-amino-acid hydrolase [Halogeometricum limi]